MDGKITISMVTDSSQDEETVRISIVHVDSKTQFVIAEMSLKDFSLALLGRGRVDCDLKFNNLESVSTQKQTKIFTIQTDKVGKFPPEKLHELSLDGWNVVLSSYKDPRNYILNPASAAYTFTATVEFERYV